MRTLYYFLAVLIASSSPLIAFTYESPNDAQEAENIEAEPLQYRLSPQVDICDYEIDCDGDGYSKSQGDCDETDINRSPGNPEIADAENHDEDCNPLTFGTLDKDGDGLTDATICNEDIANGIFYCGRDCDDENYAIGPGSQKCIDESTVGICKLTNQRNEAQFRWEERPCGSDLFCINQPNGTGICAPGKI